MAKNDPVPASPGMFRSALAPAAAICLGLGALLGLGSLLYLADPSYPAAVTQKILVSGILSGSARNGWALLHYIVSAICFLSPALVVTGMVIAFRGQAAKGMNLLSNAAHSLRLLLRILGWVLLAVFILRFVPYLLKMFLYSVRPDAILSMVLMEALSLTLAVFAHRLACRFLYEAEGCTASIGYTLASRRLDPGSIPAYVASGLTVLGVVGLVLTADRMITMTIGYDGIRQFYTFVWSKHPGQWLCAGSLFFGAVGDFLLSAYLRFFKRTSERAVFYATYRK